MAVKVMIPTPLRQFTGKQSSIECNAATVGEALGSLTGTFSELKKHLFTDDGKIRSFVNVYLNDEVIRFLSKENTPTKDGDTISIVPSIAGGSGGAGVSPAVLRSIGNQASPVAQSHSRSLTHSRRRE